MKGVDGVSKQIKGSLLFVVHGWMSPPRPQQVCEVCEQPRVCVLLVQLCTTSPGDLPGPHQEAPTTHCTGTWGPHQRGCREPLQLLFGPLLGRFVHEYNEKFPKSVKFSSRFLSDEVMSFGFKFSFAFWCGNFWQKWIQWEVPSMRTCGSARLGGHE